MSENTHPDTEFQTQLLEIVADAISGGFLVYDRNDTILFASAQVRNFLPVRPELLAPGARLRELFGALYDNGGYSPLKPDRRARPAVGRDDWIAGEIAALWKERSESTERRGQDRWMSLTRRRFPSGFGVCVLRDISEHRKREDQWRADLERVQVTEEILENLPFPVLVKDRSLTYVGVNRSCAALYNRLPEDILGRNARELLAPDLAERVDRINSQVLETGEPFQIAERVVRADGSTTAMLTRKFRVGKPGRYLVVTIMEDLSDLLGGGLPADAIFTGMEGLDFVHSDMRPPDTLVEEAAVPVLPIAGRRVLLVTQDSRIEQDGLSQMLGLGLDATSARSAAEVKAITDIAAERQMTIDLIAIDSAMPFECLEVAQASGIDVLVFEAFQMERELMSKITRHLLRPKNDKAEEEPDVEWQVAADAAVDVLVAEDNAVNRIVFSQILEGFGYTYVIAGDGEEAVRLWRELNPRIVLMDVTLPKLNGFEAASKIRETEEMPGRTPIIGVLSPAVEGDRDACWAAGMNDVVMKPLSPDILEEKFRKYLADGVSATKRA